MAEEKQKIIGPDDTPFGQIHARNKAAQGARRIEVPEWGEDGKPLVLYAYPLTVRDVVELERKYGSISEQNVMQIIRQCLNEKGEPYFSVLDKVGLMNEPADIIGRLLIPLNGETSTFGAEIKKNN